jgi:hypothetical protein
MKAIRYAAAALGAALAAASLAAAAARIPANIGSDYSDLWWNPQESGWGMNIAQQGETAFVTLFVYGPDGKPTWYFASDARVFALDASGNPAFRGTLYKANGPWLGGPFDPANVAIQPVGQLVIEPRADARLNLSYSAEGVSVSKDVVRNTFSAPEIGTTYLGSFSLREAVPGGTPYGTVQYSGEVLVQLAGDLAFMRAETPAGRCEYRGKRTPMGKYARIEGEFSCTNGEAGTYDIAEFEVTQHGFSGYLRTFSASTNQYGRFAAARL